jgi:hypothetical protein
LQRVAIEAKRRHFGVPIGDCVIAFQSPLRRIINHPRSHVFHRRLALIPITTIVLKYDVLHAWKHVLRRWKKAFQVRPEQP